MATRRWLGFALLVVVLAALFVRLGFWQLHRLHDREAANAIVNANASRPPVPPGEILGVGQPIGNTVLWRRVTVTGSWDAGHQLLVRNRGYNDDQNGFEVLTPLVPASGPALLVDRGWVQAAATATTAPAVPAPQAGTVTVIGRIRQPEPAHAEADLPPGQVLRINTPEIAKTLPYPVFGGYAELIQESPRPPSAPALLPAPATDDGPHASYAVQWFCFATIAIVGYFVLARREALGPPEPDQDGQGQLSEATISRTEG